MPIFPSYNRVNTKIEELINMEENIDLLNKEAFITDLTLIKSCLRLLNASISYSKSHGENFSSSENEEIHILVSKIDRNLSKIKENISWVKTNQ